MKTDNVVSMAAFQEVADELEMRQGLAELEATVARAEPRPIDAARFWRTVVAALLENHVYSAQVLPLPRCNGLRAVRGRRREAGRA